MADDAFDTRSFLAHQLCPALAIDSSGLVLAANKGICRMLARSYQDETSILGSSVTQLGIVPIPGRLPILWTWNDIFEAAINACQPSEDIKTAFMNGDQEESDEFWNQEAGLQSIIEIDVYVDRNSSTDGMIDRHETTKTTSIIKARANIRWHPADQSGLFVITFTRKSQSPRSTTKPSVAAPEPWSFESPPLLSCCSCHAPTANFSLKWTPGFEGLEASAPEITASIIPYIMSTLDTEGQAINISESWYRFSGLDEEASVGRGWLSSIHPDDVDALTESWADVLRNKRTHWGHQARYRRGFDGAYTWFLIRAEPYKDSSGTVLRWYASMMDINEWVIARLEADRRRQSMLTLFSQTDVMLWGIDTGNHLHICEGRLNWNPTRIVTLLSDRAVRRQNARTNGVSEPAEGEELILTLEAVLQGRQFRPIVEHWEGDRFFRTRFVVEHATHGGNVQAAIALTFDITDERARTTLLVVNQRLVSNEKAALDANMLKGRFLANMSHEIRTPISGIIGLTEHLLDCALSTDQTEFASGILETAKYLLTLINDVLDFSKLESGHMDVESIPFSPEKLINDVLAPLRFQAKEKGIALTSSCNISPDAIFFGDPWRMRQILTNLIGNSLKFTDEGHVELDVHAFETGDAQIVNIQFVVHDNGVGIGIDKMKALFKPFHQADNSTARLHGGTGLGLVISQQLVGLMGGHIELESTRGVGTTATCNIPFRVYDGPAASLPKTTPLPRRAKFPGRVDSHKACPVSTVDAPHGDVEARGTSSPSSLSSSEPETRILLVEDNHINRKVITLALEKLGYVVFTAHDGQEALNYLCKDSGRPRPHAVLMDCMMPIIDGYEATRRIRRDVDMFDLEVRTLPIIALTASTIKGDREKCWEAGMDDYLTKPAARDALARTISKWTVPKGLGSVNL